MRPPDSGGPQSDNESQTRSSHGARQANRCLVFRKSSTPTGVAVKGNDIFVTLFVTGQLMRVPLGTWKTDQPPVVSTELVTGLKGPHTVLVRPDGTLWISEHLANRIVSIKP